eukprot:1196350-Prorocentrum_minimum.AAC.5
MGSGFGFGGCDPLAAAYSTPGRGPKDPPLQLQTHLTAFGWFRPLPWQHSTFDMPCCPRVAPHSPARGRAHNLVV